MTAAQARQQRNVRLISTIEDAERTALDALRKFFVALDDAIPHLSEDKPRRKAIDSTFEMIERLVTVATGLAKNVVVLTQTESGEPGQRSTPRKRTTAPAKAAKATKSAKKATKRSTRSTR
jgi:hypothetical protein